MIIIEGPRFLALPRLGSGWPGPAPSPDIFRLCLASSRRLPWRRPRVLSRAVGGARRSAAWWPAAACSSNVASSTWAVRSVSHIHRTRISRPSAGRFLP